jgi:hypothetical protein
MRRDQYVELVCEQLSQLEQDVRFVIDQEYARASFDRTWMDR